MAHGRIDPIGEIHLDDTAIRAGDLIHDAAGFAEEGALGMQGHLGQMQRRKAPAIVIDITRCRAPVQANLPASEYRERGADAELEGRRAGKPRTRRNIGPYIEYAPMQLDPLLHELGGHAAYERDGRMPLACTRGPAIGIGEVDETFLVPFGAHVDAVSQMWPGIAADAPVDARGNDAAALMILVIAREFGSSGDADAVVIDGSRRLMVLR